VENYMALSQAKFRVRSAVKYTKSVASLLNIMWYRNIPLTVMVVVAALCSLSP